MTIFDIDVRLIECPKCGAPLQCARVGGTVQCGYCQASCLVRARQPEEVARKVPSAADEVVRIARLKHQQRHPTSGHAYDLTTPPADFATHVRDGVLTVEPPHLLGAWEAVKEQARTGLEVNQHRVCWLAVYLAYCYFRAGDEPRGRATLETAFDLLSDAAHRQLLRCRLAWEAAKRGDVSGAAGWLGECDPAPELLELDTEYRAASARLALARNLPEEVFDLLGTSPYAVPVDDSHWATFYALRVAAWETRGDIASVIGALNNAAASGLSIDAAVQALGMPLRAPALRRERERRRLMLVSPLVVGLLAVAFGIAFHDVVEGFVRDHFDDAPPPVPALPPTRKAAPAPQPGVPAPAPQPGVPAAATPRKVSPPRSPPPPAPAGNRRCRPGDPMCNE